MDRNKDVHAVKFTNADIGSAVEFDPDEIAASADIFCYVGETRDLQIIGKMRYKEIRLLDYYPQLIGCDTLKKREMELRERSVFAFGKNEQDDSESSAKDSPVKGKGDAPIAVKENENLEPDNRDNDELHGCPNGLMHQNEEVKSYGQVKFRPKPDVKTSSVHSESEMDQSCDKPTDGVRNFGVSGIAENDVCDLKMMYDLVPISSSTGENLGLYNEDVKDSVASLLSRYSGLSYLRNPHKVDDLSVALPSDTLIGVWDNSKSIFKTSRILPHGKGQLLTTDNKVIYVGDFKNGKRCGFGTALVVEKWTDPYNGVGYYQGNWVDNCRHGFGRLEFASGMRYNGEWYLDRPQGRGMLIYPDGSILKGHFAGGLSEGSFTYYSSNGYVDLLDFRGGCLIKSRSMQKVDHYSDAMDVASSSSRDSEGSGKKNDDSKELLQGNGWIPRKSNRKQCRGLKSLRDTDTKSENGIKEDAIAAEEFSCITTEVDLNGEKSSLEVWQGRENDDFTSGEIDLDGLLEHLLHTIQVENEVFVKYQMSKVKIHCEDLLSIAEKELCKISETHAKEILKLEVISSTRDKLNEVESKMNEITQKFDGLVNLCESILDGQDKTENKISALDVHVSEIADESKSLKEAVKKSEEEKSALECALNCHICQDRRRDCVLMPCMHMDTCTTCISEIRRSSLTARCPMCRTIIQGEVHIKLSLTSGAT